jgi:hypothetical protein
MFCAKTRRVGEATTDFGVMSPWIVSTSRRRSPVEEGVGLGLGAGERIALGDGVALGVGAALDAGADTRGLGVTTSEGSPVHAVRPTARANANANRERAFTMSG